MIRSRSSDQHALRLRSKGSITSASKWLFTAELSPCTSISSKSKDRNVLELNSQPIAQGHDKAVVGYDQGRIELSAATCRPSGRPHGPAGPVVRRCAKRCTGPDWTPVIPAFFADYTAFQARQRRGQGLRLAQLPLPDAQRPLLPAGRQPRPETANTASLTKQGCRSPWERRASYSLSAVEATWFDSATSTTGFCGCRLAKGFWTPMNIKEVHAYGVEI